MKLYLNTETGLLTLAAAGMTALRRLDAKRGDLLELEVVPSAALTGATGILAAKVKGAYTGGAVAMDAAWTAPATEGAGYLFSLSLDTAELDALFTGETPEVTLMAEITWSLSGATRSTQTFDLVVARDVWRGSEQTPEALPDGRASQAEAEAGTNNDKWMTPLRTAQAIAALAEGGGGAAYSPSYELKDESFTAEAGKAYATDTTSASIEVTLPASPTAGDVIGIADAKGTWGSNHVFVLRNGNKIEGVEFDFTNNAAGTFFSLVYIDATTGWRVLARQQRWGAKSFVGPFS